MSNRPLLKLTNPNFFKKIIKYHGLTILNENDRDQQFFIEHFRDHNFLVDLNHFFSQNPSGDLMDRTGTLTLPFNYQQPKPWTVPDFNNIPSLKNVLYKRVTELTNLAQGQRLNLFWSGGIDSTLVVTAFLKYSTDLSQLRIVYSPMSMKENPHFFLMMTTINNLELYDYSGENYFHSLDGISITGDISDEITASLDESFYKKYMSVIHDPWESVFRSQDVSDNVINFSKQWFAHSGMEIKTLLEARWWFYICSKFHLFQSRANVLESSIGFFDITELEHFIAANLNKLVTDQGYHTYKQFFKDFIFEYDKNKNYNQFKTKVNSYQVGHYRAKRSYLQDQRHIAILSDNTRISTPNMPLLSETEYRAIYGDSLDYLFNRNPDANFIFYAAPL